MHDHAPPPPSATDRMSPEALKAEVRRLLHGMGEAAGSLEDTALMARWPEAVRALGEAERSARVRVGTDTVLFDDEQRGRRGFVRAVLKVPLGHEKATVYGVFVEVDRAGYQALREAFEQKREARVWGRLATKLPLLEDAFETEVEIVEDGGEARTRVVSAKHPSLLHGPAIGP